MPQYRRLTDLPLELRDSLPGQAQEIFCKAYNQTSSEESAWAAVKACYEKGPGGNWKPILIRE